MTIKLYKGNACRYIRVYYDNTCQYFSHTNIKQSSLYFVMLLPAESIEVSVQEFCKDVNPTFKNYIYDLVTNPYNALFIGYNLTEFYMGYFWGIVCNDIAYIFRYIDTILLTDVIECSQYKIIVLRNNTKFQELSKNEQTNLVTNFICLEDDTQLEIAYTLLT